MSYSKADQLETLWPSLKSKNGLTKPKVKKLSKVKTKTVKRSTVENKLDKLVSQICRRQGYCTTCGKKNCVLNAHHFKSRKYKGTRWYLPNLICLCVHCHLFSFTFSAHKTPEAFKKKMIELKGEVWAKDIEEKAQSHTSWKTADLVQLLEKLK